MGIEIIVIKRMRKKSKPSPQPSPKGEEVWSIHKAIKKEAMLPQVQGAGFIFQEKNTVRKSVWRKFIYSF